ncbi:cilia- and flagella-associated protein 43 [Aplysia californica]|uniref:Cilia- and flagella-associated protein 43 n=1 Tax=Aplysia californica TaxID=6500 RepID=A0ABM0JYE6_APLCA|nr:cilia- and flagella-associated protein 43 [Aplysia californica]
MDSGVLNLAWSQGYDGSRITYIEPDVLCYQCGRNVKTISTDGKQGTFAFKGTAVGPMAVHNINKHIAVGEYCQNPKIYVYAYPTYSEISVLEGGAELQFQSIAFSESDYLVSVSGIPNFHMVLWNYFDGTRLTSVALTPDPLKTVSFNKTNWRQICVMTDTAITLWNIEQCDSKYILLPQKIKLPAVDPSAEEESEKDEDQELQRSPTKMSKYAIDIPDSAVAGLTGEQVEQLEEIRDMIERVCPVSIAWLPTGDFYVGCEGGQLFKVDSEMHKTRMLYSPQGDAGGNPFDRGLTSVSRGETDMPPAEMSNVWLRPGSLQCIALHQAGLYAAGKDGVIRLLDVTGEEVSLQEEVNVDVPVSAISFNSKYQNLAWGSPEGKIQSYKCGDVNSVVTLASFHHGDVMGVGGIAYGSDCSVSLREDGLVQVWKTVDGTFVSQVSIQEPGETLACSRIAQYAAVGTKGGQLCFIDLTNPEHPRLIMRHRLFKNPIKHLVFNGDAGTLLFAASNDHNIFIIDARPTQGFAILGFVEVSGNVEAMATYVKDNDTLLVASCNNNPDIFGSNLLYRFNFTDELIRDIRFHYKSPMNDLKEESCSALKMGLRHAICGLAVGQGEIVFALSAANKKLLSFSMPEPDKKLKKIDLLLNPSGEYPGHQLSGGDVTLSHHLKWLLSHAPDGQVKIRTIGALDRTAAFIPHDYNKGGIKAVAFSDDCQYILSCGYDSTVSCYHWNHLKSKASASSAKQKRDRDMDFVARENQKLTEYQEWNQPPPSMRRASQVERERKERIEQAKQGAQDKDEIYVSPPPSPRANATWLEQREIDARRLENQHFADVKRDIRTQIRDIRRTIQHMMSQNKDLPEIEKLGRHEFDLDLEEQNRLQAEGEAEIKKVREDIEFDNLAKLYLREKIKEECWDKMQVKGRALQAFNSSLEVSNFPLRPRTMEIINLIKTVSTRRKIEMREAQARKELVEKSAKPSSREDEGDGDEAEDDGKEHPSISGSLGSQYGGANELFYNQFDLHTREQKVSQIVLLEDAIHRIKEAFNKEFNEVFGKKEQEISKVKDKNKRIAKIIEYLGLEESVDEPAMSVAEKPELLLEVADSEITVEKYLTPEQQKKLDEQQKLDEERLAKEKGDNARERALDMMMGGVLEIKKEDELKKDVPKPAFMLTKKEEEWNEEEQKQHKDYLKKVQELVEEREKYRKQLETELRKLQANILENLQTFDDTLNVLFMRKIKVMMVIYQEELKILRLRYAMLIQEEIETREGDLNQTLEHKRKLKQLAFEAVAETRKNYENFRNLYELLQAEDKIVDKSFRRDFTDVSALMVDQLYKQFRRRPRIQKYRAVDTPGGGKSANPYSDRPSSSLQLNYQRSQVDHGLDELDKFGNAPEGCEPSVWERMCKLRRKKVESETLLKVKSNILADMMAFMQKRQEEDDLLKNEIEDIGHQINKLKEDEQRFVLNLEVQLLLKQGQIEVDAGPFIRDFRDSVLVHRSVVEDLNNTIKQLGESKIASMVESKDFRKGIIQLEWEHKKMSMQMEDLENKMKDIQFIKVTREIQAFLQEDDYEAKKATEIATLEQTITLQKKHHEKNVDERKKILRDLSKNLKYKGSSNNKLDGDLMDLNVVVNERRQIEEVNAENRDDGGAEKRYQEIVQRRKLVDLAKAQAQEVAVLRAEVERLRMRTFPALVQVER